MSRSTSSSGSRRSASAWAAIRRISSATGRTSSSALTSAIMSVSSVWLYGGGAGLRPDARTRLRKDHVTRARSACHRGDRPNGSAALWLVLTRWASGEALFHREGGQAGARGDAELLEHVLDVAGDRVLADDERGGDRFVRLACRDQAEYLDLPPGQSARRCRGEGIGIQSCQVGHRPETFEDPARRVDLHGRRLVVANGAA